MKSAEIEKVLASLKELHITDNHVMISLQKIRNDAMATKGGVQRLVKLACVPRVLKLLYHYVSADKTETEKEKATNESKVSVALSIVANMLVDTTARQQVKRDGMETLVTLLTDCSSEEVHIRCCRSLSNLAMDHHSRSVMAQAKAVPALVNILQLQYIEVKNSKDDAAVPAGSKKESNSSVGDTEDEVELEAKYPSVALVEAACRVLRRMHEDSKVRQELIEAGIVAPLSVLIKSEESKLVACVLRTMAELWTKISKRITEKMASEVSRAGIMKILMELVDSEDDKLSHHAFTILLPLTGHPRSAALIGASDGVDFLFSHLDSSRRHIGQQDLISGLCQLSREAVNRVKMREVGVLKILLDTLKDGTQLEVQDRVISALVNFLYDDASLSILLEGSLVDILLTHLQRCGDYMSDLSLDLQRNAEEVLHKPSNSFASATSIVTGLDEPGDIDILPLESSNEGFSTQEFLPGPGDENLPGSEWKDKHEQSFLGLTETSAAIQAEDLAERKMTGQTKIVPDDGISVSIGEVSNTTGEETDSSEVAPRQRYSMHSPTYQAETMWRMEDYNPGITCKSYGTMRAASPAAVSSDDAASMQGNPYSPLSTLSCHSPSQGGQFSPLHSSPGSSPAYSYTTLSPAHSLCDFEVSSPPTSPYSPARVGTELFSPLSPPAGITSPELERSSPTFFSASSTISGQVLVFSSSEDDDDLEGDEELSGEKTGTGGISNPDPAAEGDNDDISSTPNSHACSAPEILSGPAKVESMTSVGLDGSDHCHSVKPSVPDSEHERVSASAVDAGKRKLSNRINDGTDEVIQRFPSGQRFLLTPKANQGESNEDAEVVTLTKRRRVASQPQQQHRSRSSSHASVSQNNILILLSRLSVRNDLNKHLANSKVLTCLLDHLALAREPHGRCVRVLSRIMSSPHCLSPLLAMCAPAIVVKTLMLDADGKLVFISRDGSSSGTEIRLSEVSKTWVSNSSSVKKLLTSPAGSRPLISRTQSDSFLSSMTIPGHSNPPASPVTPHCSSETSNKMDGTKPGSVSSHSELLLAMSSQDRARIGVQLLADLSNQVLSPYGEGVVQHTFHRSPASQQLLFATSLLFLQASWSQERRQKLLFQKGALDRVLTALQTGVTGSTAITDVLVLGLTFLAHILRITPKYSPTDPVHLLQKAVQALRAEDSLHDHSTENSSVNLNSDTSKTCLYASADKDLSIMVSDRKTSKVLAASREHLATNSSFFSAMLQGNFIESTQSQVPIKDASIEATVPILHFLHGCGERCSVLRSAETGCGDMMASERSNSDAIQDSGKLGNKNVGSSSEWKQHQLQHVLNMIILADRFNLPDLGHYLCAVVSTSFLDDRCAEEVVRFAIFHELWDLVEDGIYTLLLSSSLSVASLATRLTDLARGHYGECVSTIILSLIKQGVAKVH